MRFCVHLHQWAAIHLNTVKYLLFGQLWATDAESFLRHRGTGSVQHQGRSKTIASGQIRDAATGRRSVPGACRISLPQGKWYYASRHGYPNRHPDRVGCLSFCWCINRKIQGASRVRDLVEFAPRAFWLADRVPDERLRTKAGRCAVGLSETFLRRGIFLGLVSVVF